MTIIPQSNGTHSNSNGHSTNGHDHTNGTSRNKSDFLQVEGSDIVLRGEPILLKGCSLGGWMLLENFMNGHAGHEHQIRSAMKEVMGIKKYEFFFDRFLEYYFGEADAKFLAGMGFNCIRIAVNDMNPRVFKAEGLKHLDRVVNLCGKYGIYSVIDLHAHAGGQNMDWHSDNGTHQALFWEHKDFQDRTCWLWEILAEHFKDNIMVAGYNPMNEPTDSQHTRLLAFYERIEKVIRAIDPHHILFLDGKSSFGYDFSHFKTALPNAVYACHDYSIYGFPAAPRLYDGSQELIDYHRRTFQRKADFMLKTKTPIWNSEFGPTYQTAEDGEGWEEINKARYEVLKLQLKINRDNNASYSLWTYKDIGVMGLVCPKADSPLVRLIKPFMQRKKELCADAWAYDDKHLQHVFGPLEDWLAESVPSLEKKYPPTWKIKKHTFRMVRNILLSEELANEYATYFDGLSEDDLDAIAKSWAFENCEGRENLVQIMTEDAKSTI